MNIPRFRRSKRWDNKPMMHPGVDPDDPSGTKADPHPETWNQEFAALVTPPAEQGEIGEGWTPAGMPAAYAGDGWTQSRDALWRSALRAAIDNGLLWKGQLLQAREHADAARRERDEARGALDQAEDQLAAARKRLGEVERWMKVWGERVQTPARIELYEILNPTAKGDK